MLAQHQSLFYRVLFNMHESKRLNILGLLSRISWKYSLQQVVILCSVGHICCSSPKPRFGISAIFLHCGVSEVPHFCLSPH